MTQNAADADAERRKNEIQWFSALATGSTSVPLSHLDEIHGDEQVTMTENAADEDADADADEYVDADVERRKTEIGLFSALATGSMTAPLTHIHEIRGNEQEAISKQSTNEALGSRTSKKEPTTIRTDDIISSSKSLIPNNNIKAALASLVDSSMTSSSTNTPEGIVGDVSSLSNNKSTTSDIKMVENAADADVDADADAERRKKEIGLFSALATGSMSAPLTHIHEVHGNEQAAISKQPTSKALGSSISTKTAATTTTFQGSGTFISNKEEDTISSSKSLIPNNNIEAALASLVDSSMTSSSTNTFKGIVGDTSSSTKRQPMIEHSRPLLPRRKPQHNQMYSECVLLPRPLFFGYTLPTRVVEEALRLRSFGYRLGEKYNRENEENAHALYMADNQPWNFTLRDTTLLAASSPLPASTSTTPRSSPPSMPLRNNSSMEFGSKFNGGCDDGAGDSAFTPQGCKNFEGAIMAYGYGFARRLISQITHDSCTHSFENDNDNASRVKLYVPVWGDVARLEREDRVNLKSKTGSNDSFNDVNVDFDTCQSSADSNSGHLSINHGVKPAGKISDTALPNNENVESLATDQFTTKRCASPCVADSLNVDSSTIYSSEKDNQSSPSSPSKNPPVMSENLFSQYALGDIESYGNSIILSDKVTLTPVPETTPLSSSSASPFPHLISPHPSSSPTGSVEGSELKKQVGLNDNLSRALESFSIVSTVSLTAIDAGAVAEEAAAASMAVTDKDGRPLTNLELMGGHVPFYGCDDDPLPNGADLGNYQTKKEQEKHGVLSEWQEIIALKAVPSIFSPIVCPNYCLKTDDSYYFLSSADIRQGLGRQGLVSKSFPRSIHSSSKDLLCHETKSSGISYNSFSSVDSTNASIKIQRSLCPPPPLPPIGSDANFLKGYQSLEQTQQLDCISTSSRQYSSKTSPQANNGRRSIHHQHQYNYHPLQKSKIVGWWNVPDDFGFKLPIASDEQQQSDSAPLPMQLLPRYDEATHSSEVLHFPPSIKQLMEQNRSLSNLHSSTPTSKFLPFLSDRPPSTKYLQIDTRYVGFHSLGEVEPLFCSLAIWHVGVAPSREDAKSKKTGINSSSYNSTSGSIDPEMAPNFSCGRITESLRFDVVSEAEVETKCKAALWPNAETENNATSFSMTSTRCGIFPLPSNFRVSDLYAVIIVHKIVSDDSDIDIYTKSTKQKIDEKTKNEDKNSIDLQRHRTKAGRSSDRFGKFLMPFAFGVASLVGVIGAEPPSIPITRVAQVTLFKYAAGRGERPIIEHILAQFKCHGNFKPSELTKEGKATFVMRNFGYLGLHSAIHPRSRYARDRVVDFTGDLQVRRKHSDEVCDTNEYDSRVNVAPSWHENFVGEPTVNGGRSFIGTERNLDSKDNYTNTAFYAQELAQLPLSITQSVTRSPRLPGAMSSATDSAISGGGDAESFFYTSLCNELLCHPRILHQLGCVKRNVIIKIEVRRLKFCEARHRYIATLPLSGPSLHNTRRGCFLVNELFTSCAHNCLNPHFLDEFKIKLPLIYSTNSSDGKLVALFTAYNVSLKEKETHYNWRHKEVQVEDINDDGVEQKSATSPLELLGCGYLPIFTDGDVPCLVSNGLHDVKLKYMPKPLLPSIDNDTSVIREKCDYVTDALILESLSSPVGNDSTPQRYSSPTLSENFGSKFWRSDKLSGSVEETSNKAAQENLTTQNSFKDGSSDNAPFNRFSTQESMLPENHLPASPSPISSIADFLPSRWSKEREPLPQSMSRLRKGSNAMVLQVRTIALSSVHPQNKALAQFFGSTPTIPRPLTWDNPDWEWATCCDKLSDHFQHDARTLENQEPSPLDESLLQHTIDIASPSCCPHFELVPHFVRIMFQLWRSFVCGNGEPSLIWANPASLIPVRLRSFSTMLFVLNSVTSSLMKSGLKQLDGKSKWNITTTSHLVMMLFDEEEIFLDMHTELLEDILQKDAHISNNVAVATEGNNQEDTIDDTSGIDSGHIMLKDQDPHFSTASFRPINCHNNSIDILKDVSSPINVECSSDPSPKTSDSLRVDSPTPLVPSKDDINLLDFINKPIPLRSRSNSAPNPKPLKIDTKADFQTSLLDFVNKPIPLRSRSNSAPNPKPLKIDTKTDFQTALNAANSPTGTNPFGSPVLGPAANRRKWMTLPNSILATIQEDNDKLLENGRVSEGKEENTSNKEAQNNDKESPSVVDTLDTELVLHKSRPSKVKQMRVPFQSKQVEVESIGDKNKDSGDQHVVATDATKLHKTIPNDKEIELAGIAFLETIAKTFGNSASDKIDGEDKRVGFSHHRKTRSRCSIDWTLPPTDLMIENHQQMEHLQLHDVSPPLVNASIRDGDGCGAKSDLISAASMERGNHRLDKNKTCKETKTDFSESCAQTNIRDNPIKVEKKWQKTDPDLEVILLPNYTNRIVTLGKKQKQGRWFPYTYEVIIFQWSIFLSEQPKKTEKARSSKNSSRSGLGEKSKKLKSSARGFSAAKCLSEAASKVRGLSIRCAPVLFEIIKKSLGFRIDSLFRRQRNRKDHDEYSTFAAPPLVSLDSSIISALEMIISMVTDACIDSRNFDSWILRKSAIVVNDSIVRFLRDLFAFLDTRVVHRLVLLYFSRFGTRDGKHLQDGDSKIGLRCSEEICKLKLNAITLLIQFADFVKVNSPIMEHWGNWPCAPTRVSRHFFTNALSELENLSMPNFTASEGPTGVNTIVPSWKPHWLIELVTDICLSSTCHVELSIRQRSASLLFELFWSSNQEGKVNGTLTVVASMYVPFISKILGLAPLLSSVSPKSQLRKDLLPCVIFIIQSAPSDLLRALWRKLCKQMEGRASYGKFGGIGQRYLLKLDPLHLDASAGVNETSKARKNTNNHVPSILDVFSLLNLALKTFEYEGSEANLKEEVGDIIYEKSNLFKEFLPAIEEDNGAADFNNTPSRIHISMEHLENSSQVQHEEDDSPKYATTSSRKWHAHDGAVVIINASRNIVREYHCMLQPFKDCESLHASSNQMDSSKVQNGNIDSHDKHASKQLDELLQFSIKEKVIFARAIASVYLHCLSLRQSDIVYIKTLIASVEILKVFDIEVFLAAVGETLQHWMRVILVHCGARRAKVRIEALEFLALILRLTWGSFGSFYRVRVPLIGVQTEIMERIVATAAARYYRKQRRLKLPAQFLSNEGAEAALTPFWRTLDRLHHRSASNNAAFKSALNLLAESMKVLYRAYIASHALAIVNRTKNQSPLDSHNTRPGMQVSQVISASGGFSKKILGSQGSQLLGNVIIHSEAVEEAFLAAADTFLPTELPLHRVNWLRKLAEFHSSRSRFAEEGTCRLLIHKTLRQAADLNENLWRSIPFWPWANDSSSGVHFHRGGSFGASLEYCERDDLEELTTADCELNDVDINHSTNICMQNSDWNIGGNKRLFYGVNFPSEYNDISSWISVRELEEDMVEEAEAAGELFLKAGIVESSRYAWSLSSQYYSSIYNYAKLAYVYHKMALAVESQIPSGTHLELSSPLGRFYRVHFHGGAADELNGKAFIYRASANVKLDMFCESLVEVIYSIVHDKTPIEIVKDDGRMHESHKRDQWRKGPSCETITIKVTPLRPLLDRVNCARGTSEWFYKQSQISDTKDKSRSHYNSQQRRNLSLPPNSSKLADAQNTFSRRKRDTSIVGCGGLVGVKKFLFTQPKDRSRGCRDILKAPNGDVSVKCLKVTELLVKDPFPASVTRQSVLQRTVCSLSPLEAGVEEVCSWCAVLFRTAVATHGRAVIGNQGEEGIGKAATKVVADCLHNRRFKEIGQTMLNKDVVVSDDPDAEDRPERLSDDERNIIQKQLARAIVKLMELLHLLIGRNRDLLLPIIKAKKNSDSSAVSLLGFSVSPTYFSHCDGTINPNDSLNVSKSYDDAPGSASGSYASNTIRGGDNTLALQRELQFRFISMTKVLYPHIQNNNIGTPRWMRQCCQDKNYFSSGAFRQSRIAMAEELSFFDSDEQNVDTFSVETESRSIPEILRMTKNSPHGSYGESSTSRVSRNPESPQVIRGQDSPSQFNNNF